jgi:hypothetical protein
VDEQKKAKYSDFASPLRKLRQQPVNVTAMIVSSMGAVYSQSLKELRKSLGCSSREMQRRSKRKKAREREKLKESKGVREVWKRVGERQGGEEVT